MNRSHIKYISGLLLFGLNGIVSAKINLSSYEIVFFRTLFGGMFLLLVYLWINRTPKKSISETSDSILTTQAHMSASDSRDIDNNKSLRKEYLYILLSGISMGLSWIFLYEAYRRIGVGLSSITYYCGPVIVMLSAPFVFRKKISLKQFLCFIVVFAGILLVSLPGLSGEAAVDAFGLFCGFASAFLHALMVIFTMKAPHITGLKNSMLQLVISFFTVAVFLPFEHGVHIPEDPHQWFWILFLSFINTGVGCYLYFSETAKLPVTTVSILGYLEPLSAVFFAMILLHEALSLPEIIGAVMILGGAIISELNGQAAE